MILWSGLAFGAGGVGYDTVSRAAVGICVGRRDAKAAGGGGGLPAAGGDGVGGVAGRTCPPAEEALADLLEVPHPVEPTMRQVMEDSGMEYEGAAIEAAAAAIG